MGFWWFGLEVEEWFGGLLGLSQKYPRYPWVVGLIKWTLFKIGGCFEFFPFMAFTFSQSRRSTAASPF